jgi:hypothetical protein
MEDNQECLCSKNGISGGSPQQCPACRPVFQKNGWDGIDAHWRTRDDNLMAYEKFWKVGSISGDGGIKGGCRMPGFQGGHK